MPSTNTPEEAAEMLRDLYAAMRAVAGSSSPTVTIPAPPDGIAWDLTGLEMPFDPREPRTGEAVARWGNRGR